ncbi:MAG: hypothetical protein AB1558_15910 [Thermodesulfobacteriota bacterium]
MKKTRNAAKSTHTVSTPTFMALFSSSSVFWVTGAEGARAAAVFAAG